MSLSPAMDRLPPRRAPAAGGREPAWGAGVEP